MTTAAVVIDRTWRARRDGRHTVRHLGDLHREAGRLADARECYEEALALYRATADPPPLDHANALRPAALLKEGGRRP